MLRMFLQDANHISKHVYTPLHPSIQMHTLPPMCVHAHMHTQSHTHSHPYTCMHTGTHTHNLMHVNHRHVHIHTHIHTLTHTTTNSHHWDSGTWLPMLLFPHICFSGRYNELQHCHLENVVSYPYLLNSHQSSDCPWWEFWNKFDTLKSHIYMERRYCVLTYLILCIHCYNLWYMKCIL